ncbi:MAG: efflux RND transporter periplasmic adaptor subunit [Proteobacteria bacterium]|nr:efflux RND transporter periplasmic adaptor subunit [Pseudomonadota bacterium]
MTANKIAAITLFLGAALWIASGALLPHESGGSRAAVEPGKTATARAFRVAVIPTSTTPYSRTLTLSGRTEAERRVSIFARTGGELTELRVRRGDRVAKGDVVAVLSDDARDSQVAQAQALLTQRASELEARRKLIDKGMMPRLDLANFEAQHKTAEAALAAALAERERGIVRAPWAGVITDIVTEVGGAAFAFAGKEIARLVALDPMLAVVEVSERRLPGIKVGDRADVRLITGATATGRVRHVASTASPTTRTYRVEVELPNPDGAIPDGITAEVSIPLAAVMATRIPRSAPTFSAAGELGVRIVDATERVEFVPIQFLADEPSAMWVTGIPHAARVIVQGQDFVRAGEQVAAIIAAAAGTAAK